MTVALNLFADKTVILKVGYWSNCLSTLIFYLLKGRLEMKCKQNTFQLHVGTLSGSLPLC